MRTGESSFLNPGAAIHAAKIGVGMTVADFGCGAGFFTRAAARAVGPSGTVWSIDANHSLLARTLSIARAEGLHNIHIVAGSVEHREGSHVPDESMQYVIAANMLFSAQDKHALVEEIWRVLAPRGRALIIDWKDSFGGIGPSPTHVVDERAALTLFKHGGFELVESIPAGAYHWGFVVRKRA